MHNWHSTDLAFNSWWTSVDPHQRPAAAQELEGGISPSSLKAEAPMIVLSFRRPANLLFMSPHIASPGHPTWSLRLETLRGNSIKRPRAPVVEGILHYLILSLHQETQENSALFSIPGFTLLNCFSLMNMNYESSVWISCLEVNYAPHLWQMYRSLRHNSVHEPHRGFKLISPSLFSFCPNFLNYLIYR